jgi:AraC-like DNA-binding protein
MPTDHQKNPPLLRDPAAVAMMQIFDPLADVFFFVKDHESRFLHVNRALLLRLGLTEANQILGTTDRERYPTPVADQLIAGDQEVMQTRSPMIDHAEVLFDHRGRLEWFATSKYPILARSGEALGVVGITRSLSQGFSKHPGGGRESSAAAQVIDRISANPSGKFRVAELARQFGISERQLNRQFLDLVNMTPSEFLLRSRIHAAAADLRLSRESIASLAEHYGFCDQSSFTRQFRRLFGITPARYRKSLGNG